MPPPPPPPGPFPPHARTRPLQNWTPAWSLNSACRAIIALLAEPDVDSPWNCDAGNMIRAGDRIAFGRLVRRALAIDQPPSPSLYPTTTRRLFHTSTARLYATEFGAKRMPGEGGDEDEDGVSAGKSGGEGEGGGGGGGCVLS